MHNTMNHPHIATKVLNLLIKLALCTSCYNLHAYIYTVCKELKLSLTITNLLLKSGFTRTTHHTYNLHHDAHDDCTTYS